MSILDKPLAAGPRRRRRRWPFFVLPPVILGLIILLWIGPGTDAAFVQHFFTSPQHFTYSGHSGYVSSLAWSRDGRRIASASGDGTVQVWDASSGGHVLTYRGHKQDVTALAWSPDGRYLASGGLDTTTQVWDASTGQNLFTYHGQTDVIFSLSWSPDSQELASASEDGSVQVWRALTGQLLFETQNPLTKRNGLTFRQGWSSVAWSPDGRYLAAGSVGNAEVFNAHNGQLVSDAFGFHNGEIDSLAWSPNSHYLATGQSSGDIDVWDAATAQNVFTFNGTPADVFSVAWSPDSQRIASGGGDALVSVWDALSGKHLFVYRGHADVYPGHFGSNAAVYTIAWSPDGKHIASGGNDNTAQVWPAPAD
ncbi:MAG TPA: WD40 repeat domain-containing protein [Ktedonobacteraceae bacterium]